MSIRARIETAVTRALAELGAGAARAKVVLERPRENARGDLSTPVAMSLARTLRRSPLDIAEDIASRIRISPGDVESMDVARPGFINFRFAHGVLIQSVKDALRFDEEYGRTDLGHGARVQCEYVSANPTGPLVVVSARAAAVGSVLVNLLRFTGFDAEGEYYVNDYGRQVGKLGASLLFRLRELRGQVDTGEEIGAYPGAYLAEIAAGVSDENATTWLSHPDDHAAPGAYAASRLLDCIREDMELYNVRFDNYFRESTLHPEGTAEVLRHFVDAGQTYESEGAVYFRSTAFGDEKDRVLRKSNGDDTYFLSDIAYHKTKIDRGFIRAIGLLGPDHHGHVPRMKAAMSVLGADPDWFDVVLVGWVRLMENGVPISMSKRAGEFVTMRELVEDVGVDVAKYLFLMRRANSPLDFDLSLARKQSDENPVFYVQYAHARISSVVRFARSKGVRPDYARANLKALVEAEERALMLQITCFPYVVEAAAKSREPHRLTNFAQELATAFHQFYHKCRIVTDDESLSAARLALAEATRRTLRNTLTLLGVSAPQSM